MRRALILTLVAVGCGRTALGLFDLPVDVPSTSGSGGGSSVGGRNPSGGSTSDGGFGDGPGFDSGGDSAGGVVDMGGEPSGGAGFQNGGEADVGGEPGNGGSGGSGDLPPRGTLALGAEHSCMIESDGLRCWGWNVDGNLGYGHTNNIGDDETAASAGLIDVGGTVLQIAPGVYHTCALLEGGKVRCWGLNVYGELGYGNLVEIGDNETPAAVGYVNVGGTVVQLALGGDHTCALLEGGSVKCWGQGSFGVLGYGNGISIGDNETPASTGDVDVGGEVTQLVAGVSHTCALLQGGSVRCWGLSPEGELGYGNTEAIGDDEAPASVGDVDVGGKVLALSAGYWHTCALLEGGKVRCWGLGGTGGLGYGSVDNIGDDEAPATAGDVDVGATVVGIAAGGEHTCALLQGGKVRCWGYAFAGQLGYGNELNIGDDEKPSAVGDVDVGGTVLQLGAGGFDTCALLDDASLRCWGYALHGELGYGSTNNVGDNETPASAGAVPFL